MRRSKQHMAKLGISSDAICVTVFVFMALATLNWCWAAENNPALPITMSMESDVHRETHQHLPAVLETAITFVRNFPPRGYENNLFSWSKDRKILNGKSLTIILTTSKNPALASLLAHSNSYNMDALTMAPVNTTSKTMSILLVLFVDKIMYDSNGRESTDGFSKLVLALAHEIYGNVQHFLEFNIDNAKPQTWEDRVDQERKAFLASLMFLGSLRESDKFLSLPDGIREGLMRLLPSEIRAFRSWQRAHGSQIQDPGCAAMLKSINEASL